MRKKVLVLLLAVSMALTIAACGKEKEDTLASEDVVEKIKDETEEIVDETTKEAEPEETKKITGAVLGGDAEDFDDFEYLYAEELRTDSEENEETGKKESTKITVLIPDSDYASVNRGYAYADEMGVNFKVSLNPYFQYKQEDYLLAENIQTWLDNEYDEFRSTDCKDLVISEIEELDKNRALVKVSYIKYDKWKEMNIPIYKYIYVKELAKDLIVMAEVEINLAEATGKTPELLAELEAFYEFDIDWSKEEAEAKVEEFLANDTGDTDTFSTGYMIFDLPKGWAEDYDYDYSVNAYAPDGDAESAQCVLVLNREFTTDSYDVTMLLKEPEYTKSMFQKMVGETASNIEVFDMDETSLGRTVKVSLDVDEDGLLMHYNFYFAATDNYMYTIYAVQTDGAKEDALAIADDVIANAKLKN